MCEFDGKLGGKEGSKTLHTDPQEWGEGSGERVSILIDSNNQ